MRHLLCLACLLLYPLALSICVVNGDEMEGMVSEREELGRNELE
jgi:hypothetical protein